MRQPINPSFEQLVRMLASKHPLRDGLSATRARDVPLVLTGPQLYAQLTRDLGWTSDNLENKGMIVRTATSGRGIGDSHGTGRSQPSNSAIRLVTRVQCRPP